MPVRMPSPGQRFIVADSTYEAKRVKGTSFKATLVRGEPLKEQYRFTMVFKKVSEDKEPDKTSFRIGDIKNSGKLITVHAK